MDDFDAAFYAHNPAADHRTIRYRYRSTGA